QLFQILDHPGGRFRAKRHRLAVQPAEGAVVLLAPPATAAALGRKRGMVQKSAVRRVVTELFVIRGELWRWQRVEVSARGAADHPGTGKTPLLGGVEELRKRCIALTGENEINSGSE